MPKYISLERAELLQCRGAASFLQSDFWGRFKSRFGWKALAFRTETRAAAGQTETALEDGHSLLALHRRLGPGLSFAYVPWGPELSGGDPALRGEAAAECAAALRPFLPGTTAFIRFDFPWFTEEGGEAARLRPAARTGRPLDIPPPFVRAAADVQPPDTVLVNLVPEEGIILGAMKPKWRYNIGLAEKKGVILRLAASSIGTAAGGNTAAGPETIRPEIIREELENFYTLYRETAARDGIVIHGIEYYAALFDEARMCGVDVRLYLASHEGEDLAGIVTLFRGGEAVYLYGASSSRKRNLMAPYALQWRAMKDAKAAGCGIYDLFGIPPRPQEEEPGHPMAGLFRFKTGFIGDCQNGTAPGGRIIHRSGSWDYPCRPLAKALYGAAEKTRKKIWDIKKRLKRR